VSTELSTCYTRRRRRATTLYYSRGRVSTIVAGNDRKDTDTTASSGVGGRTTTI